MTEVFDMVESKDRGAFIKEVNRLIQMIEGKGGRITARSATFKEDRYIALLFYRQEEK